MTKGGGKPKFSYSKSQRKAFKDLKYHHCSALAITLPNLQSPPAIETYASDYAIGIVLTQQGHLMGYHSETLYDIIHG